jgi:exosortase
LSFATVRQAGRHPGWIHLVWLALFLLVASPTLVFLFGKWTRSIWLNGHGLFVPFICAFLAVHALRGERVREEEPSAWGFAVLVPALALVAIDGAIQTRLLAAVGLLLALPGLSLLVLGPRRTRALLFPWLLSFFMLPIPSAFLDRVHLVLRELTTAGSERALQLLGLPVYAEGTLLHLPHGSFRVVEECSGFAALYAALTIALVLAYLAESRRRRWLLLLVPWPLAMASNVLRVVLLAFLAERVGYGVLETPLHVLSGYMTFVLTLGLLFLFAERPPRSSPT